MMARQPTWSRGGHPSKAWTGGVPLVVNVRWVAGQKAGAKGSAVARHIAEWDQGDRGRVARVDEEHPDPLVHARYLAERPGSTGLFAADPARPPRLETIQEVLRGREWHWQIVVSMRVEDAAKVGLREPGDWRDLARRIVPQYAQALGIQPTRLAWVGAMHQKAGQPHIHIMAWPEGRDRRPRLSREELRAVRQLVARETFGAWRAELAAQRTANRDLLVLAGRVNLDQARRLGLEAEAATPGAGKSAPAFPRADLNDLVAKIEALTPAMPGTGRIALAFMPEPVRTTAREIADWIMSRPALAGAVGGLERATRDLTALYTGQGDAADAAWDKARTDVRDRIAQAVLRAAAERDEVRVPERRADDRDAVGGPEPSASLDFADDYDNTGGGTGRPDRGDDDRRRDQREERLRTPAGALAYRFSFEITDGEHRDLAALLRRADVERDEQGGVRASGEAFDAAVRFVSDRAPGSDGERVAEAVARQAARQQGWHGPEPAPTPAESLARALGVDLDDGTRADWTEVLRGVAVRRDGVRLQAPAEDMARAVAALPAGGRDGADLEAEVVIQAYRQHAVDWREARRTLRAGEAVAHAAGLEADPGAARRIEDLLHRVALDCDPERRAPRASGEGYVELLHDLTARAPAADRWVVEREIVHQAWRMQSGDVRAEARRWDPAGGLARQFGFELSPEERGQLAGLLRQAAVARTAEGWPQGNGAAYEGAIDLVRARATTQLLDPAAEVAAAAARAQGLFAGASREAVAALAEAAGVTLDAETVARWTEALRGLVQEGPQQEMAQRVGVTLTPEAEARWAEELRAMPAWVREPERTPAAALAVRLGATLEGETEARWMDLLHDVGVYHDESGCLVGEPAAIDALRRAVLESGGEDGARTEAEVVTAAWRVQQADRQGLRGLAPVEALERWSGADLGWMAQVEMERLLARVEVYRDAGGLLRARGDDYERALSLLTPDGVGCGRVGEEVARQADRVQMLAMRPADALARSLGLEWRARERPAMERLLREVELARGADGSVRAEGARYRAAVDALFERAAGAASRRDVERAVTWQAARAQRQDAWSARATAQSVLRGAHGLLDRERRRAEAKAELAQMREAERAEARQARQRAADMGLER